jgi:hypothetical protein
MRCSQGEGSFSRGVLSGYGNIELSPSSGVLNHDQGLFEGLKVYRRSDSRVGYMMFRPEENVRQMQMGAEQPKPAQPGHGVASRLRRCRRRARPCRRCCSHPCRSSPRTRAQKLLQLEPPPRFSRNTPPLERGSTGRRDRACGAIRAGRVHDLFSPRWRRSLHRLESCG